MSDDAPALTGSEIAVVGMAVRAPGSPTLDAFWSNLRQGVESVRHFTTDELVKAGESPELIADPDYVPARPYLENIDQFDAEFFGLSPQDAAITDPQHRIFLEVGWEALEHAGYDPSRFAGQVGVFATCGMNSYMMQHLVTNPRLMRTVGEWLIRHTGNDMSFLATSLSYRLDLKGPSFNVQCACSSALVAIHLATQSLLGGECDMALAGGSVIAFPQDRGYLYQTGEILARDGHCRPFDANATGTLFGSGAGVVVLRRLADALADGDQILAVLKGSAANNDGSMKVGFLAPSVEGQSRVITEALAVSGVEPDSISYVEAHGTGTIVGDPIEITALTEAYRRHTQKTGFCRIGSLKSNIGHLGEAAGALGLIKTVLSLQHQLLPPSLNYDSPNPRVDFASSPFVVNDTLREWTNAGGPRRAAVTALGAGGTNCHVILEEAPNRPSSTRARRPEQLLLLSAKTPAALERMRVNLASALVRPDAPHVANVAYTLHVGRKAMPYRWSAVVQAADEAIQALKQEVPTQPKAVGASRPSVVFLFAGGGVQYPDMGRGLYEQEPVFKDHVDQCLNILRAAHGIDLRPALFPAESDRDEAARTLARSTQSILSIFTIEYALCRLWMSWGVAPAAMSGHSLGEYVAACVSGVFSLEDALAIVKARGDIFGRLPAGAMLSVLLPEADVAPLLSGRLSIAAVNAASSCVLSGPVEEIDALDNALKARGVETQAVHIAVAAHSPMLEPFLDDFHRTVASVRLSAPAIPFVSNLTGNWITAAEATDASYWVRHLRHTVRFADGLTTILATPDRILLEVGPGRALTSLARQHATKPLGVVTSLRHPSETMSDGRTMLNAVGRLWSLGVDVDWSVIDDVADRRRVALPTYSFDRQRYWVDAPGAGSQPVSTASPVATSTLRRTDVSDWLYEPGWKMAPVPAATDADLAGDVIVFADADGLAIAAVSKLPRRSDSVTHIVDSGDQFRQIAGDRFQGRPGAVDDYTAVFSALGERAAAVSHIVYAWTRAPRRDAGSLESQLERHFFGPLALAQAIARQELEQPISVTFVTSGVAQVAGEATISPAAATVRGPSRVMPREMPQVRTRIVDLLADASESQRDVAVSLLAEELGASSAEPVVAHRHATRWVETFTPRSLARTTTRLREGGVYLITGGAGGLGLELAAHLASARHAKLVLVGRSVMPPRSEWDRWLETHDSRDSTSQRLRRFLDCEAAGGHVLYVTADVADRSQMDAARRQAIDTFGSVHGILHTAGTLDDGLMPLKTRESALSVLRPKVMGTDVLTQVFGGDDLDFLILFSSISSVLGLQGQADYTAANAYLDAVASKDATEKGRIVSIGWGPWRDVGLAVVAAQGRDTSAGRPATHPWLDRVRSRPSGDLDITVILGRDRQWMIAEHVVRGADAVLPGTGFLELARAAMAETGATGTIEIADVLFQAPVVVPASGTKTIEMSLRKADSGFACTWHSGDAVYATAQLRSSRSSADGSMDVAAIRARCPVERRTSRGQLDQPFMDFGPRWANLQRVNIGTREAVVELALPPEFVDDTRQFLLHPALLDMATGGAQAIIPGFDQAQDFYVPFSYGRVRMFAGLTPRMVAHVRLGTPTSHDVAVFDVTIADETGRVLVDVSDFCMSRVESRMVLSSASAVTADTTAKPVATTAAGRLASEMLADGMHVAEGLDALDRILAGPRLARVVVSPGDLGAWRNKVDAISGDAARPPRRRARSATASGDIERDLSALWQDLLGVDTVSPNDDFFELGGHSLIAVKLLNRIEKQFGKRLKLATLFETRTMGELAGLLRGERELTSFVSLVPIQPKGTRPPLYVAHAVGGEVLSYLELTRGLGADQPFYGFRSVGHDGSRALLTTIKEQAAFYVAELLIHQPHGPYFLAGYSHGGRVAFEMARQLTDSGHDVAFVGVIDTWPQEGFTHSGRYTWDWMRNLPRWFLVDFSVTGWTGNRDRMQRAWRILKKKIAFLMSPRSETHVQWEFDDLIKMPAHIRQAGEVNLRAFLAYEAGPYAGVVTLFRAYAQPLSSPHSRDLGWSRYARTVEVVDVPGNHGSLMHQPDVSKLAEALSASLAAARLRWRKPSPESTSTED
ncbi:MAG: beta-ketoacyl synthase N-terminal-like domain-containing protein, partial [Acidobacteriota bacterium]